MKPSIWRLVSGLAALAVGLVFMETCSRPNDFVLAVLGLYEVVLWACLQVIHRSASSVRTKYVAAAAVESVLLAVLLIAVIGYSLLLVVMLVALSSYRIWLAYSKPGQG